MKNLYLYALVILSLGAMKAKAQSRAEIDSVKNYTTEFLADKLAKDKDLQIDTIWVDNIDDVGGWGNFGEYSAEHQRLVLKFLASKVQEQELQDKIDLANFLVPITYGHEGDHREKSYLWNVLRSPAWDMNDYFQQYISNELSARLAECFSFREKILNKEISKNMLKHIADNIPTPKAYHRDYLQYLLDNEISEAVSQEEADLMLAALVKWMWQPGGKDGYYGMSATFSGLYAGNNISRLSRDKNGKSIILDFDMFIQLAFLQNQNGKDVNIFAIASEAGISHFLRTIARFMKGYEKNISENETRLKNGWGKSIKKLTTKKDAKKHAASRLRAVKFIEK